MTCLSCLWYKYDYINYMYIDIPPSLILCLLI